MEKQSKENDLLLNAKVEWMQGELDKANSRLRDSISEIATLKEQNRMIQNQLNERDKYLSERKSAQENQKIIIEKLEHESRITNSLLKEAKDSSHYWWQEAEQLKCGLQAVYDSKSWQITWPLRQLMSCFQGFLYFPRKVIIWFVSLFKRLAKTVIQKIILLTYRYTWFRTAIYAVLNRIPKFELLLKNFARSQGILISNTSGFEDRQNNIKQANLSHRANEILHDLKVVLIKTNEG